MEYSLKISGADNISANLTGMNCSKERKNKYKLKVNLKKLYVFTEDEEKNY